jgi:hypothetical protein
MPTMHGSRRKTAVLAAREKQMNPERDESSSTGSVADAHLPKFTGGSGRLKDFACVLAEVACGLSREQARKQDQDDFNAMTATEQIEWRYNDLILSRRGLNRPPPKQWRFEILERAFLQYLIRAAKKNGWEVTNEWGVDLDSPIGNGYVEVRVVHGLYANTTNAKKSKLAEALGALLVCRATTGASGTDVPGIEHARVCNAANWYLKPEVQRDDGLAGAVYGVLKKAHLAGEPRPTARQVLDSFANHNPLAIVRVVSDGCDYSSTKGEEKSADIGLIQKRIHEFTTERQRRKKAAQDPPKAP